ncbi:sigma-70 family RNA polymerase sigma factor [Daejeonella sp. JGW-45]|uniref:RNA polymerase sigma factor n=1 Tax=Daejeonella sp. JGW-45 TaxID=3034148 RepID=UPI0023EC1D60|nr:sigma-70 family RNA polymerase sigma factor [Daejeonella sp. JGW-45]
MIDRSSSDEILVEAMKNGDPVSFDILFNRYWQTLYTTAYTISRDNEASSGIVHDIFLNLWLKREKLQIGSFKGYITASARYHVYRYMRTVKRNMLEYRDVLDDDNSISVNDGELLIRQQELQRKVERHLEGLPKRCKEIFTLSRRDELSNDEIAKRLAISKRTVENQLTNALHHLRLSLKDISWFLILVALGRYF